MPGVLGESVEPRSPQEEPASILSFTPAHREGNPARGLGLLPCHLRHNPQENMEWPGPLRCLEGCITTLSPVRPGQHYLSSLRILGAES